MSQLPTALVLQSADTFTLAYRSDVGGVNMIKEIFHFLLCGHQSEEPA